jgi:hypothetical protein
MQADLGMFTVMDQQGNQSFQTDLCVGFGFSCKKSPVPLSFQLRLTAKRFHCCQFVHAKVLITWVHAYSHGSEESEFFSDFSVGSGFSCKKSPVPTVFPA